MLVVSTRLWGLLGVDTYVNGRTRELPVDHKHTPSVTIGRYTVRSVTVAQHKWTEITRLQIRLEATVNHSSSYNQDDIIRLLFGILYPMV